MQNNGTYLVSYWTSGIHSLFPICRLQISSMQEGEEGGEIKFRIVPPQEQQDRDEKNLLRMNRLVFVFLVRKMFSLTMGLLRHHVSIII